MYIKTLSVSDVNRYIKKVMDNDFILNNIVVSGEISNFKLHSSGHMYFSLKDKNSKINCVMFRSSAKLLKFVPENGMNVIATGKVSLYIKEGIYQFYCESIQLEGLGQLYVAFEKLKSKLEQDGFFDADHKKIIPKHAKNVGVITSPTGAAVRDIINVSKRRNPNCNIYIYPTLVQGNDASYNVIKGINFFNAQNTVDTIIIARGGGSIEELWAFNDEKLAKKIYFSKIPIVTGVGHETDYTIADFVSDRRAPTPSAAAEIAVLNLEEINGKLNMYKMNLSNYLTNVLQQKYSLVRNLNKRLEQNSPLKNIKKDYEKIDSIQKLLWQKMNSKIIINKEKIAKMNELLSAHNPLNVLNKGYSIIEDENNNLVDKIDTLKELSTVKITLKDGKGYFDIKKI